ncbi:ankyrin repeat family protein [Trifolium repens]|nr:ankyrin repeat family protein [Trifolium repens]
MSEILTIILKNKPSWIHSSDKDERLPLHYAASIGYLEGVKLLLKKCKCCTIQRDKYGYFPIHLASYGGHHLVVKKLLKYCPDSTEMLDDSYGQNILHIASNYGKYDVVRYILKSKNREHHKMINQQDKNGDTPLHLAARSCHPTVVYYLVNHISVNDLDLVNKNNKTALDIVSSFYKLDRSTLRQYLTWLALTSAGAKQSPTRSSLAPYVESKPSDDSNSVKKNVNVEEHSQQSETQQSNDVKTPTNKKKRNKDVSEPPPVDKDSDIYSKEMSEPPPPKNLFLSKGSTPYKDRVETLLLVSTLIVTASVAACFAVPGEAGDGKANNLCHTMFQVFIIFITISLFSAISSTILLFWATLGLTELVTYSLNIVMYLLGIALISLSLAFMAGLYTVISELTWLANVFLFMTVIFVVVVIVLYILLFVPSSSTNKPLRYISHYPFLFLASRAECQIDDDQEDHN